MDCNIMSHQPGNIPLGGIIQWLKSYSNVPQRLPTNYVECNGQTLSDAASIFNGQVIPDLNGNGGTQRFLRGSLTSGGTGGADTHTHGISTTSISVDSNLQTVNAISSVTSPSNSASSLPNYYEIVHLMRIK